MMVKLPTKIHLMNVRINLKNILEDLHDKVIFWLNLFTGMSGKDLRSVSSFGYYRYLTTYISKSKQFLKKETIILRLRKIYINNDHYVWLSIKFVSSFCFTLFLNFRKSLSNAGAYFWNIKNVESKAIRSDRTEPNFRSKPLYETESNLKNSVKIYNINI